jgi:ParB-like chromosome segregation protein Spo0J
MTKYIPLDLLVLRDNIRSEPDEDLGELMEDIREHGQRVAILVEPAVQAGLYLVNYGHRRVKALRLLGMDRVKAEVGPHLGQTDRILTQIAENAQRKDLTADEWVVVFDRLQKADPGMTDAKIAAKVHKSQGWVVSKRQVVAARAGLLETGVVREADLAGMSDDDLQRNGRRLGLIGRRKATEHTTEFLERQAVRDHEKRAADPPLLVFRKGQRSITVVCRYGGIRERVEAAIDRVKRQVEAEDARASKGKHEAA